MKATIRQIPSLLRAKAEFRGNSVSAKWENGIYRVYSYSTCIYTSAGCFDNSFYSVTTSKIQNILIDVFGLNEGKKARVA